MQDEVVINDLVGQVRRLLRAQSGTWGHNVTFSRLCENVVDLRGRHAMTLSEFQSALNSIGMALSSTELTTIQRRFGRKYLGMIDHVEFGSLVDSPHSTMSMHPQESLRDTMQLMMARLIEQRRKGFDIRLSFEMNDPTSSGLVSLRDFREAVSQLGVALSDSHISSIASKFTLVSNPDMVNYDDFLAYMLNSSGGRGGGGRVNRLLDTSVHASFDRSRLDVTQPQWRDGAFDEVEHESSVARGQAMSPRKDRHTLRRDSRDSQHRRQLHSGRRSEDSAVFKDAAPRTVKSSFFPLTVESPTGKGAASIRHSFSGRQLSPTREAAREASLAVWGASTPVSKRGQVPKQKQKLLDEQGKWMCLVCLYENTKTSAKCGVCGAANPKFRSSQVAQECPNCHFANSEFAEKCEMCGVSLAAGLQSAERGVARREPKKRGIWRDEYETASDSSDGAFWGGGRD